MFFSKRLAELVDDARRLHDIFRRKNDACLSREILGLNSIPFAAKTSFKSLFLHHHYDAANGAHRFPEGIHIVGRKAVEIGNDDRLAFGELGFT